MRFSLLLAMSLFTALGHADNNVKLIVELTDGSQLSFLLSSTPELKFSNRILHIQSANKSADFEIVDISQFYFQSNSLDVESPFQKNYEISYLSNSTIIVKGCEKREGISLFAADGTFLKPHVSYSEEGAVINLESLTRGVYIIKIGKDHSFKILKK